MLSRREILLIRPWEVQRYEAHKRKVRCSTAAVDVKAPPVYSHVTNKLKKLQNEKERLQSINKENIRLLQKLGNIMSTKRLENFWRQPRPNFLNREKIPLGRPKTCMPRLGGTEIIKETYTSGFTSPASARSSKMSYSTVTKKSITSARCPTCSGRPVKKNQVIPEERIPWQLPKKSWNIKIYTKEFEMHICCKHCR